MADLRVELQREEWDGDVLVLVRPVDENASALDALKAGALALRLIATALDNGAVLVEVFAMDLDWQARFTPRGSVEEFDQEVIAVAVTKAREELAALGE